MKAFNNPTNYQTLFPNEEYNNISEEYSIYGPGAYLVYLLNKATDKELVQHKQTDLELLNRRADLNQLQINATNTNKEHYYLEGVVNLLTNTLIDWKDTDTNIWKKTTDENQLWQNIAAGKTSFIPYNRLCEIIKNRLEAAEFPLSDITAKLHPESYDSLSWVYARLGLNHGDVEILKSGGGDVSSWLNNNCISINKLLFYNNVTEKELFALIKNSTFVSFSDNDDISISHKENEVFLNIQEGDLKKLRCFMILTNATKWKCATLIAVLQALEIKEFNTENATLQLQMVAKLSLIAEVFEEVKSADFLNNSLVKNRLSSLNLSFTNKAIQGQATTEDKVLNFLINFNSNNLINLFSGRIQSLFTSINSLSNNKHTLQLDSYLQLNNESIDSLFKIATLIKRFQQTDYTIDELSKYITALIEFDNQKNLQFNDLVEKLLSDSYLFIETKNITDTSELVRFENELNAHIANNLSILWGIEESIVKNYITKLQIAKKIVETEEEILKIKSLKTLSDSKKQLRIGPINDQFKAELYKIVEALYKIIFFTQHFSLSTEVISICISDLTTNTISETDDLIAYFEYFIGVLHLQKYLDESTEDNSSFINSLLDEKIDIINLTLKIAQREKCTEEDIKNLFESQGILESKGLEKAKLYQTLYKINYCRTLYGKLQLSYKDILQLSNYTPNTKLNDEVGKKITSNISNELYGEQLMADRDILVPIVLHKLSKSYEDITNIDRLSEYLLMDVQASDKIAITPVREAINAVQWYMANVKSGLEAVDTEKVNKISAEQWLYIEKFRVWQAEQKLELYPNEYFQIDNLKNASELFKQLKSKLQGDTISQEIIKSSLMDYLEQWSNLSINEVVASYAYRLNSKTKICLLTKCKIEPNTYYYVDSVIEDGCLINTSEWEKINTKIDADENTLDIIYAFNKYYIFYTKLTKSETNHQLKTNYIYQKVSGGWSTVNILDTRDIEEKIIPTNDPLAQYRFKPIIFFCGYSIYIELFVIETHQVFSQILPSQYSRLFSGEISINNEIKYYKEIKFDLAFLNDGLIPINNNNTSYLTMSSTPINSVMFYGLVSQGIFYQNMIVSRTIPSTYDGKHPQRIFALRFNNLQYKLLQPTNAVNLYNKIIGLKKLGGINGFVYNANLNSYLIIDNDHQNLYSIKRQDEGVLEVKNGATNSYKILPFINKFSLFLKNYILNNTLLKVYETNILDENLNEALLPDNNINYNEHYTYDHIDNNNPEKIIQNATKYLPNSFDTLYAKEFFIYIPCLISSYLRNNLQFEGAVKWLEKVFNPHKKEKDVLQYFFDEEHNNEKDLLNKWLFEQYITTLFKWADNEYRVASWESINHAMQLYLQIEDLLGEEIKICNKNRELEEKENRSFSKIDKDIQKYFGSPSHNTINELIKRVQGRLYNLRNGLNLDGSRFTPSEYGTEIDPINVKLLRNSNSLDSNSLQALQDKKRIYQFRDLMPITESIIDTTIQFGNQFYSILQQKDNEEIQLLMHTQTMAAELFVTQNFELQIQEIELQLNALLTNQQSSQLQLAFYQRLLTSGIIEQERTSFNIQKDAHQLQLTANTVRTSAAVAHLIPNIFGVANGGMRFGEAIESAANVTDMLAHHKILTAQLITDEAEAKRRGMELEKEIKVSMNHLQEISINIQATEKRLEIIKSNLAEHKMRIAQQQTMLDHLTNKFTNVDLYSWMSNKLSSLYISVYQIALRSLNQLQDSYNYELDRTDSFIPQQPWDSLRKGLLAGEGLKLALIQLKDSYFRNNIRRKEVEKVISLRKKFGVKEPDFWDKEIPSFNLYVKDFYPKESKKIRIKSLSVSIPGIVGPYETFNITLKNTALNQEIEISRGINDFGVFPESINDGRYMPFEGYEIKENYEENDKDWTLSITKSDNSNIVISDIILNVKLQIM